MKFLGIDYGTKRIGVAISDENGVLAFPKKIVLNDLDTFKKRIKGSLLQRTLGAGGTKAGNG